MVTRGGQCFFHLIDYYHEEKSWQEQKARTLRQEMKMNP